MPDKYMPMWHKLNSSALEPSIKYQQQSDGTYAQVVAIVGSSSGSTSSTSVISYSIVKTEDLGNGTAYYLKHDGTNWLMVKKTYTDTSSSFFYANLSNNSTITTNDAAWNARQTLTYQDRPFSSGAASSQSGLLSLV